MTRSGGCKAAADGWLAEAALTWTSEQLRKIGRDLGQRKSTAHDAVIGLGTGGFLTPVALGGFRHADGVA